MSIPERPGRTGFFRRFGRAALSAALLAAALLLAPGTARAQTPSDPRNQCGALASGAAACSNQAYASGIRYDTADGWDNGVAGPVTLTVTGGSATAISAPAPPNTWTNAAIVIRTAAQGSGDSASRAVTLRVGDGSNDVTITEHATQMNHGVQVHQFGKAADSTTVTPRAPRKSVRSTRAQSGCGSTATTRQSSARSARVRLPTWAPRSNARSPGATNCRYRRRSRRCRPGTAW